MQLCRKIVKFRQVGVGFLLSSILAVVVWLSAQRELCSCSSTVKTARVLSHSTTSMRVIQSPSIVTEESDYAILKTTTVRTKVNPHNFKYIMDGSDICKGTQPFLLIMVLSASWHKDIRATIRQTWGQAAISGFWPHTHISDKIKLVFLVGKGRNKLMDVVVQREAKVYGDVVQEDFVDSYNNLTLKTVMGLRWVSLYCKDAKFVLKADDDVFLSVPHLLRYLKNFSPTRQAGRIYGYVYRNSPVQRQSNRSRKWDVPFEVYPNKTYPSYVSGNTYVISGDLVPKLFAESEYVAYLHIEDVFTTGIVGGRVGAQLEHSMQFAHWEQTFTTHCAFIRTNRISVTNVNATSMNRMWQGLLKNDTRECFRNRIVRKKNIRKNIY